MRRPPRRPDPAAAAVLLPSSGTTGLPKLVELTHRALVANLVQMELPFPAFEGGRLLGLAPFFHSMGLQCVLHRGLGAGAAIVALARFDLEGTLRAMQEHGVDQALVAPPLLAALVNHPVVDDYDLSSLTPARQRRRAARPRARARRGRALRVHRRLRLRHLRGRPARGRAELPRAGGDPRRHAAAG